MKKKLESFSSNYMNDSENSNKPTDLTSMKGQEFLLWVFELHAFCSKPLVLHYIIIRI